MGLSKGLYYNFQYAYIKWVYAWLKNVLKATHDTPRYKKMQGVYIIIEINPNKFRHRVLYIGSSKDIYSRVYKGRHKMDDILFDNRDLMDEDGIFRTVFFIECFNHKEHEIELIKKYRPVYNIQHNGTS